jgi:hypothetical protein
MRQPDDLCTLKDAFMLIYPLCVALHRTGVLPLSELSMRYEDVLAQRMFDGQEGTEDSDVLQQFVALLHMLQQAEGPESVPPPASGSCTRRTS